MYALFIYIQTIPQVSSSKHRGRLTSEGVLKPGKSPIYAGAPFLVFLSSAQHPHLMAN